MKDGYLKNYVTWIYRLMFLYKFLLCLNNCTPYYRGMKNNWFYVWQAKNLKKILKFLNVMSTTELLNTSRNSQKHVPDIEIHD